MPIVAYKKCNAYHCEELIRAEDQARYCDKHQHLQKNDQRPSSNARGYNYKWRGARKRHLAAFPFCALCLKEDRITKANEVHHIIPHKGDRELLWDKSNWQSLCKSCHSKQTAQEQKVMIAPKISANRQPGGRIKYRPHSKPVIRQTS